MAGTRRKITPMHQNPNAAATPSGSFEKSNKAGATK